MSKCYAKVHIPLGNKIYKPGALLPELTDAQWKRLQGMNAIRTEHDPVAAAQEADAEEAVRNPDDPPAVPGKVTGEGGDKPKYNKDMKAAELQKVMEDAGIPWAEGMTKKDMLAALDAHFKVAAAQKPAQTKTEAPPAGGLVV